MNIDITTVQVDKVGTVTGPSCPYCRELHDHSVRLLGVDWLERDGKRLETGIYETTCCGGTLYGPAPIAVVDGYELYSDTGEYVDDFIDG